MSSIISVEQETRERLLVDAVVASFDNTESERLKQVMKALVRHLHAFVREIRLTEDEWNEAIAFLTQAGRITTPTRQEFVLLSDVLGASMQVVAINNEAYGDATEATVFGPFFVDHAPRIGLGEDMSFGAVGEPCFLEGSVKDTEGNPIPGARIEVWEADEDGFYDVQYTDDRIAARAHLYSDEDGAYNFWGLFPTPYPIPHDGPVGDLLAKTGRSPMRASHLHFMVAAPGYRTLVTHIFVRGDEQLGLGDAVFGVKESLIKDFVHHPAGTPTPDGRDLGGKQWCRTRFDIVLAPGDSGGMHVSGE